MNYSYIRIELQSLHCSRFKTISVILSSISKEKDGNEFDLPTSKNSIYYLWKYYRNAYFVDITLLKSFYMSLCPYTHARMHAHQAQTQAYAHHDTT